jgi:hypothetical protein
VKNPNSHRNRFPLLGAHSALQCEDCHKSAAVGLFRGLSTDCASCHIGDYLHADLVDHQAAGFSTKCETCHSMDAWVLSYNHSQNAGFALVGAHSRLSCPECHIGGKYSGTESACVSCHLGDYKGATDPSHSSSAFPTDCLLCHSTASWGSAAFNHNSTPFPLTGAHTNQQCSSCHSSGQYAGLPTSCVSCHLSRFTSTANPNHRASGFHRTARFATT